jgi:hypothetical protein
MQCGPASNDGQGGHPYGIARASIPAASWFAKASETISAPGDGQLCCPEMVSKIADELVQSAARQHHLRQGCLHP